MGLLAKALTINRPPAPIATPRAYPGFAPQGNYLGFANAYSSNEIVASAIDLRSYSASEPHIIGRRYRRNRPGTRNLTKTEHVEIKAEIDRMRKVLASKGMLPAQANHWLIQNGFYEEVPASPGVRILNNPNPFTSRGQLWATVTMDHDIAGNAFIYKARGALGNVGELWRLRPDRVKVIPDRVKHVGGYEYRVGREVFEFPAEDIMHFKTRHPLDDYYGMSPLMQLMERVNIDNFQRTFLRTFFERGGTGPGAILTSKTKLPDPTKQEIRERHRAQFGASGFLDLMIVDNTETTYTPMSLNRGLRDALPKEIDAQTEARIAMRLGIPGSILGLLIGYETSSYANQRQAWQVLWDVTMTPLLSDFDDVLNLSFTPEFGGLDEVAFELSDIKALQEDVDKIHDRHRKNVMAGMETLEEARESVGLAGMPGEGTFLIPGNVVPVRVTSGVIEMPQLPAPSDPVEAENVAILDEVRCPHCQRWAGANMNVGATAYCPTHKAFEVVG